MAANGPRSREWEALPWDLTPFSSSVTASVNPLHPSQVLRLGRYYCNEIVAPSDSLTDRTPNQMGTVTRQGLASIAAASIFEPLASILQHLTQGYEKGDETREVPAPGLLIS